MTNPAGHLSYVCLLIPRSVRRELAGDLAHRLEEWLPQICMGFGWRIEYLDVRRDYLQWKIVVQSTTSPVHMMRILRQYTSERIFAEFPRLKEEDPCGDFWAPGYLIRGRAQPYFH